MTTTNPVDTAILAAIVLGGILGLVGLSRLFSPLALLLALTSTISIYPRLVQMFGKSDNAHPSVAVHVLSFFVAFLLALIGFGLLNRSLSAAVAVSKLQMGDRVLGVVAGMVLAHF
ncbi:MAG: CvpA family protein [Acidobacteria bacterium]|nr:CvpA family protein [Acidobacteriota bacterium]